MATAGADLLTGLEDFTGELLQPGEEGYEQARLVHNGLVDKRPALVARCRGVADVVDALNVARDVGLELSVRGGGHSVAGRAVTDGGLAIDLSLMKGIHVDSASRTVRAQGGVTWGELNRETQLHGLAVTGGVISTTGIAGLTLGGGIGWLLPKYGLATDNLLSAQVVTADGSVLIASEDENPDLFWGLCGGGGNFGVVTSLEYRLHGVGPTITGGLVIHPFEAAADVWRFYRDFTGSGIPTELMMIAALVHAPDGSGTKVAALAVCHCGPPEQAGKDLAPVLAFGAPLQVEVGPLPYVQLNTLLDGGFPNGSLNYWKSSFLKELSDEAIDVLVSSFTTTPSSFTQIFTEHFHGAVSRVPVDATPVPHREVGYNLGLFSVWFDATENDENILWTKETFAALQPYLATRRYVNYLDADDSGEDATRAAYGPNYERLVQVKTKYDPHNLFRLNSNVPPASRA